MKKHIKRGSLVVAAFMCAAVLTSCNKNSDKGEKVVPVGDIVFDLPADAPTYIMPNLEAYVFDGAAKTFKGKILGATTTGSQYLGKFQVGSWETIVISRSDAGVGTVLTPSVGTLMSSAKMWETQPVGGYLPQIPEIFYGSTGVQSIIADQTTNTSATLVRNMAKIRVVVDEAYDVVLNHPDNKIILGNVPTTLSWTGKLLPFKDAPAVGEMAMKPTFRNAISGNSLQSDTLDFVIPAHRGFDWELNSPTEVTTLKLYLKASLIKGSTSNTETFPIDRPFAEIPIVAKMNTIMIVKVKIASSVVSVVSVEPWSVVDIGADPF